MNFDERRRNPTHPVQGVAIVGGTHGNERMGLSIVGELQRAPPACKSFELTTLVSNPLAAAAKGTGAGRRYVDADLNRCFSMRDLEAKDEPQAAEMRRAREIDGMLGPKSATHPKCDLILDLHSTTANTGVMLCLHPRDLFAMQLAAHLRSLDPSIVIVLWPDKDDVALLPTIARSGLTVEVGPCAHSTVSSALLQRTLQLLRDALAYVDRHNACVGGREGAAARPHELPCHERVFTVDYPRDEADSSRIVGFIHPELQGVQELTTPLSRSTPVFQMLSDASALTLADVAPAGALDGAPGKADPLYPMFVNEAAYYEQGTAFIVARRRVEKVDVWDAPPK